MICLRNGNNTWQMKTTSATLRSMYHGLDFITISVGGCLLMFRYYVSMDWYKENIVLVQIRWHFVSLWPIDKALFDVCFTIMKMNIFVFLFWCCDSSYNSFTQFHTGQIFFKLYNNTVFIMLNKRSPRQAYKKTKYMVLVHPGQFYLRRTISTSSCPPGACLEILIPSSL